VASGLYPKDVALSALGELARAPHSALSLALSVRRLDLSRELAAVSAAGVPSTVVACTTDTLVTESICQRTAQALQARIRAVDLAGGHMWMLGAWHRFSEELTAALPLDHRARV
jgi:hypothetical protein